MVHSHTHTKRDLDQTAGNRNKKQVHLPTSLEPYNMNDQACVRVPGQTRQGQSPSPWNALVFGGCLTLPQRDGGKLSKSAD